MKTKKALMIVHQPRSSTGDVGMKLRERGYELDVRRPVIGEKLPESMDEHDVAVIYGGPPSANDDLDYIKYEIDWIILFAAKVLILLDHLLAPMSEYLSSDPVKFCVVPAFIALIIRQANSSLKTCSFGWN